jgi:2-methylisocitrate lyase-like PEP mutase family enzyme
MPNPWDTGTAKLFAALGFEALATTSLGVASSLGRRDGAISLRQILDNCAVIAAATELPVSADLENCYARDPREAAQTIRLAAEAGVVGGSIEDSSGDERSPIYDFQLAVERVQAAAEMARSLAFPFVLTARAENFFLGKPDLDDTIRRLQAFEQAGAVVLYAPGLTTLEQIRTVCGSVSKPVNVVMGLVGGAFSVQQLAEAGVKRISLGSSLARAALGALTRAAREIRDQGTFSFAAEAIPFAEIERQMRPNRA